MTQAKPRVLLVDDEAPVLRGLERQLFRSFELEKATSAAAGLEKLLKGKPFDVVVSDMRMPEVNGAEFLSIVRQKWPDTMRIVLTGHADLEAAAMAINEGDIFRFLLKPCVPQSLTKALNDAVEQRHLRSGAQDLLERAVSGSVSALSGVFEAIDPSAQARALHAREVLTKLALERDGDEEFWPLESAALLSQLRYAACPEVTSALLDGATPGESEFRALREATAAIDSALAAMPRLERTREILRYADLNFDGTDAGQGEPHGSDIPWAARAIRVLNEGEALRAAGQSDTEILDALLARKGPLDPKMVREVYSIEVASTGAADAPGGILELKLTELVPGMILEEALCTSQGSLLVQEGQEVTQVLLDRLANIGARGGIQEPIMVRATATPA